MLTNKIRPGLALLLCLFLLTVARAPASAQGGVVASLEVEGNRAIPAERILHQFETRPGDPFSEMVLARDVRRLLDTGFFEEVRPGTETTPEGVRVTILVRERPVIGRVAFRGNRRLREAHLLQASGLETGQYLDPAKLASAREALLGLYAQRGLLYTAVEAETEETAPGEAAVTFVIAEGAPGRTREITFTGNEYFSDRELARATSLRPRAIYRFRRGTFSEEALRADEQAISELYRAAGFPDASVTSRVDVAGRALAVSLDIVEGQRLLVGSVTFTREGTEYFTEDELRAQAELNPGSPFSDRALTAGEDRLRALHHERGCLFSRVEGVGRFNPGTGLVDIFWFLAPGPEVTIEAVDITGNTITRDRVIRREITQLPGEKFSGAELRRTMDNLYALGYFDGLDFTPEQTGPDRARLRLEVSERERTGNLIFGGGYSSQDGIVGQIMVEQTNFDWRGPWPYRGGGQNLRLMYAGGGSRRDFSLSFTEPWLGDRPVSFGFDLYDRNSGWDEYSEHRTGAGLRFGWRPPGKWRFSLSPGVEKIRIFDVPDTASATYREEEGKAMVQSVSFGVTRDGRDARARTSAGTLQQLTLKYAGGLLGGDRDFWKGEYRFTWYRRLPAKFAFTAETRLGIAEAFGNTAEVPVFERYFVGGARSVRGYEDRSLGPVDAVDGQPRGGKLMVVESLEAVRPLNEFLGFALFADTGYAWDRPSDFDFSELRTGVGAGLRLKIPFLNVPLKIDYGYALDPLPGESRGRLHFDIDFWF